MTTAAVHTADELRQKLVETFQQFRPELERYYDYAARTAALSEEYHHARLREGFPEAEVAETALLAVLDARETPTSLDRALAGLGDARPTKIVFDRSAAKFYLFL